jgi:hypothetical protein
MRSFGLAGNRNVRRTAILGTFALLISAFLFGAVVEGQDRPRSTTPATPSASPSPTPIPPAQRPGRTTPTLGEPPPVPKLKPTPTPTPPPEMDEGDILRINADLVQLHVRVIDRNNRPINNVTQGEFHVFEDGVRQPI